jgi:hypothetical protein
MIEASPEFPDPLRKTCRFGRDLLDCQPTFRSKSCFGSQANEAERMRLYRDIRGLLCGSDSSAVSANNALGVPVTLPQHAD